MDSILVPLGIVLFCGFFGFMVNGERLKGFGIGALVGVVIILVFVVPLSAIYLGGLIIAGIVAGILWCAVFISHDLWPAFVKLFSWITLPPWTGTALGVIIIAAILILLIVGIVYVIKNYAGGGGNGGGPSVGNDFYSGASGR